MIDTQILHGPTLDLFKERIIRDLGQLAYKRILEQLESTHYRESNCSGLVAYILGYTRKNKFVDLDEFSDLVCLSSDSRELVARLNEEHCIVGNRKPATVCVYADESINFYSENYGYEYTIHMAVFLGEHNEHAYEFGQFFSGSELFSSEELAKPRIERIPDTRLSAMSNRTLYPTLYYKINPKK